MELSTDFNRFLSSIEPRSTHVAAAKAAHEKVRAQLGADSESKDALRDTYLSGSYARSTAINDINDVDVICLVDIDHGITAPDVAIAWMHGVLSKYYIETKRQGRSVGVQAAGGVWLDIVLGSPLASDGGPIWIPDREAHQWVISHPKGQIAAAIAQNSATQGYYVPCVKLLKSWRDDLPRESSRPKSYILESLVYRTIGYPRSHAHAVVNALEGIERTYGAFRGTNSVPAIPDPGYSSVNVAKRWIPTEFDEFITQVQSAAAVARKALDEQSEAASRTLWRQILGRSFGTL